MVFQKTTLARRKRPDIEGRVSPYAHALQRRPMSDRGDDEPSVVLKADETAIEEMVDAGREKEAVFTVEAFPVVAVPPRLAMTRTQVGGILHAGNSAPALNPHHALFEYALAATR